MQKILTTFLAIAMLVSSTGVTITGMVCVSKRGVVTPMRSGGKTMSCPRCRTIAEAGRRAGGAAIEKGSCCQRTLTFLAVKTNFAKPSPTPATPLVAVAELRHGASLDLCNAYCSALSATTSDPPRSLDAPHRCALFSTFLI